MTGDRWQRIEELYHSAREREGSQRAAFLKEACAGDDALRREVESLLAEEKGLGAFLEAPGLAEAAKLLVQDRGRSWVGRQIGSYQIISFLDAGGMGEVYRARDTKLGRDVALKALPEVLAGNAERMARFRREAQVLASLNHPNIAAIYGLEESGGVRALAMELVEGPTLAEKIRGSADVGAVREPPLRLDESLQIAKQIAEGLEYAHERGIIHRDLKPANVKVRPDGTVKVLDFGLAKALDPQTSAPGVGAIHESPLPTISAAATREGMILGTAAYMSPEQARGKTVDRRADIWAFGVVLYEMFTGQRLFGGETVSDTLAAVITKEPDWEALPPSTPPRIRELTRRCLTKEP